MAKKRSKRVFNPLLGCMVLFLILLADGCYFSKEPLTEKAVSPEVQKVVVIGFLPALNPGDKSGVIRNPISGAVFMAEPVPLDWVHKMTDKLFKKLHDEDAFDLVPPGQASGIFSSLVSSDSILEDREMIRKIGQAFSADALLMGYVYRWKEREGTDFAVSRPASVAFDLYFLSARHGGILWKGRFDKSQRALSENLFEMDTFVKGGGKWMTVENLAEIGLSSLIDEMPKGKQSQGGRH